MFERVYVPQWMSLTKDVREKMAEIFKIPRSGITEIRDETVLTDGRTQDDLLAITQEKLEKFCKQQGQFADLFKIAVKKVQFQIGGMVISADGITKMPVRYCDTCDSKRGRHRKGCPNYK